MPVTILRAGEIVHGADHPIHAIIKAVMLRHVRALRDNADGTASEYQRRWARQVLAGNDGSYGAILRELSLRQAVQDLFTAGGPYMEADANVVKTNLIAVLDSAIAAQLG